MFSKKIQLVAPSATALGIGRISGHLLRFNKQSSDGSGKCNIVMTGAKDDETYGVLYSIEKKDKALLDKSEGGYDEESVSVITESETLTALTYIARTNRVNDLLRPYDWYKDYCLRGALEHGLPDQYVEEHLQTVLADIDPNQHRRDEHLTFLTPSP